MLLGNMFGNKDHHAAVQRWKSCLSLRKPLDSLFHNGGNWIPAGSRKGIRINGNHCNFLCEITARVKEIPEIPKALRVRILENLEHSRRCERLVWPPGTRMTRKPWRLIYFPETRNAHRHILDTFSNEYSLYLHGHDLLVCITSVTKITTLLWSLIAKDNVVIDDWGARAVSLLSLAASGIPKKRVKREERRGGERGRSDTASCNPDLPGAVNRNQKRTSQIASGGIPEWWNSRCRDEYRSKKDRTERLVDWNCGSANRNQSWKVARTFDAFSLN